MKNSPIISTVVAVFNRDIHLALRRKTDTLAAIFFFALVTSLFPLAVGPEPTLLLRISAGVIWVSALLASMLSLSRVFTDDLQDGTLEQLLLSNCPLSLIAFAKITAHWVCSGLILMLISPILAAQFNMSFEASLVLIVTLALGTPILSLLGSIGSALTLGLKSAGALIALIILPLVIPVLILGTAAVDATSSGTPYSVYFYLMGAYLALCVFFAPIACAAALRIALD